MTGRLPLVSAQLAFGLGAERSGRRASVILMFRTPPARLSVADVRKVLQSVLLGTPALSYRITFAGGGAYQERHAAECDFAEFHLADAEAVENVATDEIERFEAALEGAGMAARLLRSPKNDSLLLMFDHALVDEYSLLLIKRQLSGPSDPGEGKLARYRDAIFDRKASEEAAAAGPGAEFWANRLAAVGQFPKPKAEVPRIVPIASIPRVAIPGSFRGSLFPYVLFSIHRALEAVSEPGPIVIGYPWGGRNAAYSDVAGCFMNTVVSVDVTRPGRAPATAVDFARSWYEEIDHADVPFSTVIGLGAKFSGSVTTMLSYRRAGAPTVLVAGVPAVEVTPRRSRGPQGPAVMVGVTVHDDDLELRLILDEDVAGYGARELGTHWRHWLNTALSSFPERKS